MHDVHKPESEQASSCRGTEGYQVVADMTEGEAECAVQRFSEANFSRISNKSGFFMGIIRRVKEDGPDKGSGDLDILPRPVRYRLRDLLDDVSAFTSAG